MNNFDAQDFEGLTPKYNEKILALINCHFHWKQRKWEAVEGRVLVRAAVREESDINFLYNAL